MSVQYASQTATAWVPSAGHEPPVSEPVVFDGFSGIYQASPGHTGHPVLMLSPFGFEELCARAFWTALAERLAAAGMASLRFDYPGTANALDTACEGLDDWRAATLAAADALRSRSGQAEIILLGQGIGATLALHWANHLGPIAASVLIEPAVSGRTYLRGLKAWGTSIAAASGLAHDAAAREHAVAGFSMPEARVAAMRALDLGQLETGPGGPLLVLEQPGGPAGKLLERVMGGRGSAVVQRDFAGYGALLTDPTSARLPVEAMTTIVDWLSARCPDSNEGHGPIARTPARFSTDLSLLGDGFAERPIRFGPGRRLAGVLCLPSDTAARGSAVAFVNAGRDGSIGWARSTVAQARAMACHGVASLRFDISGVGDSGDPAAGSDEILYSDRACDDLRAAVDHLHGLGYASLGLVGRCSGAWAAFTVATQDARIRHLALINTGYFLWDGSKSLAEIIRFAQRNVNDLGSTLLRRDGLRRLFGGKLDWRGALRFVLRQTNQRLLRRFAPLLGRLTVESRRYHDLHGLFARLRDRDVDVMLAYAGGDTSLDELRSFMGPKLGKLARYPRVSICTVEGADHNFTPPAARTELLSHLLGFFGPEGTRRATSVDASLPPETSARRSDRPSWSPSISECEQVL